jgi:hypothetical protein
MINFRFARFAFLVMFFAGAPTFAGSGGDSGKNVVRNRVISCAVAVVAMGITYKTSFDSGYFLSSIPEAQLRILAPIGSLPAFVIAWNRTRRLLTGTKPFSLYDILSDLVKAGAAALGPFATNEFFRMGEYGPILEPIVGSSGGWLLASVVDLLVRKSWKSDEPPLAKVIASPSKSPVNAKYEHSAQSPFTTLVIDDSRSGLVSGFVSSRFFSIFDRPAHSKFFVRLAKTPQQIQEGIVGEVGSSGFFEIPILPLSDTGSNLDSLVNWNLVCQLGVGHTSEAATWGPTFDVRVVAGE